MSVLLKLAERCEAATGPDRDIDHAIANFTAFIERTVPPPFTASVDAALTLVPEDGNSGGSLVFGKEFSVARIYTDGPNNTAKAATPALAICAAALRARAAE